jgi:hypothetical protein
MDISLFRNPRGRFARVIIAFTLATSGSVFAGNTSRTVAAEYDGGVIFAEEIAAYATALNYPYSDPWGAFHEAGTNPGLQADTSDILRLCAEEILWDRVMAQEARKAGHVLPRALEVEAERRYDNCLIDTWRERVASGVTTLTLEMIGRIMEKDRRPFFQEEQRQVAYIFLQKDGPKADKPVPEKLRFLRDLRWRIETGELDFHEAAKRFSEAASASAGGRIGWVKRTDRYHPAFKDLVFHTSSGALSDAVELHNGYYLVKVEDVIPERNPTPQEVAASPVLAAEALRLARADAVAEAEQAAVASALAGENSTKILAQAARDARADDSKCSMTQSLLLDRFVARDFYATSVTQDIHIAEDEARQYYDANPTQMRESGIFRLTRFTVPTETRKGRPPRGLEKARELADTIRTEVAKGTTDTEIQQRWEAQGLVVDETSAWQQGTGIGPADMELLDKSAGYVSRIYTNTTGAVFFRLDGKRDLPLIPFETKRDEIIRLLHNLRLQDKMVESRQRTAERLRLRPRWY